MIKILFNDGTGYLYVVFCILLVLIIGLMGGRSKKGAVLAILSLTAKYLGSGKCIAYFRPPKSFSHITKTYAPYI